ncbi:hypothetical protein IFR05_001243 [Cadophora sp. M221]|nr:hypothetical protein IFR05_001243 [Cadophora sp. M221]
MSNNNLDSSDIRAVPVPESAPHGLGLNPSIVSYDNYGYSNDYMCRSITGEDDFPLQFDPAKPNFIGDCKAGNKKDDYARSGKKVVGDLSSDISLGIFALFPMYDGSAADLRQPSDASRQSMLPQTPEVLVVDDQPKSDQNPKAEIDTRVSFNTNIEEANHQSANSVTSTIEPEETDESKKNSSNAFFESTLLSLTKSFKTRAIVEFSDLQSPADVETNSSSPSSTSHSETTSASTVTTDSHIYRVHLAQCSGCKKPMNSLADFERHKVEATCLDLNGECNTYDGLFEHEIFKIKELKFKGLRTIASWETLYKILFPDSLPVLNPSFMESQFMALYNKISSNKPEILEFLMARLRKRHGVASDAESASTMEATPERRHNSMEVGNGEEPSLEQWDKIVPSRNLCEYDNDHDAFADFLDFDFVGNVPDSFQGQ